MSDEKDRAPIAARRSDGLKTVRSATADVPPTPGPFTAEALARRLGISRATVSIVLRGDARRRKISEQTERRVLDAAREYNYVPNQAARMLRRQRTDVVGVILPDFRLDWAERVMDGMLAVFDDSPYSPFVAVHRFSIDRFRKEALAAIQRRDDALICYPLPGLSEVYERVRAAAIPLVFIGDRPTDFEDAAHVVWDAGAAAAAAVRHLVSLGRRRIGFLGFEFPMAMSSARLDAYRSVLKAARLPLKPQWVSMPPASDNLRTIVEGGLDKLFAGPGERPDAVFVLNDGVALPVLDGLRRRGLRVPQDVAVVSMGDVMLAGHGAIGLSTMREPLAEMGRGAAEVALELIGDPSRLPRRMIACDELQARRSTLGSRWKPDGG